MTALQLSSVRMGLLSAMKKHSYSTKILCFSSVDQ